MPSSAISRAYVGISIRRCEVRSYAKIHLYCEFLGGRIPLDIYVEGEKREGGFPLPDPRASRIKAFSRWYASLPLLITLKIRADDLGDVFQMIEENELGEDFAERLEPDVRGKFLEMIKKLARST